MRRARAALVLVISTLSLLLAGPASAGGPTSVLLVVPGTGQTASLYTSEADYQSLAELVGAEGGAGNTGTSGPVGGSHQAGTEVTLTWLIHDVTVWRVDRVYLQADGGPWISTQTAGESGNIWDSEPVWHVATRPKELAGLLVRLGVDPASATSGDAADAPARTPISDGGGTAASVPATPLDESGTAASVPATPLDESGTAAGPATGAAAPGTGELTWGLVGLVLGIALAVLGMRVSRRGPTSARRTPVPAADGPDELRIAAVPTESEPRSTSTEELSPSSSRGH